MVHDYTNRKHSAHATSNHPADWNCKRKFIAEKSILRNLNGESGNV